MFKIGKILSEYSGPKDLVKMNDAELAQLAVEVRDYIVKVTEINGGHLASSLGVVELTIALLRNYDFSSDSLIWDVGHQCYSYKILTDRKDSFPTIRTFNGISGFPKRSESKYDSFNTGHSTTSLSAAIGMLRAASLQKLNKKVVVVIGDGAMTGGMAWEALNNIRPDDDILIILNDNGMSISPNVGSFNSHLKKIRINQKYLLLKPKVEKFLRKFGGCGRKLINIISLIKRRSGNSRYL